jgi:signal transduction histidine kinase
MKPHQQEYLDTPERLVPRLGQILVKSNLIEPADLQFALEEQQKLSANGRPPLLGQVMVQLGLIEQEILDRIITRQIFQLQEALVYSNQALEKRVQERTQELENALTRLSELNQLKANFISNVSHELRMPLQFVVGYLDLLASGTFGPLTEAQSKTVDTLVKASQDMRKLVEEITEFSDLSGESIPLEVTPVFLDRQIQTAVDQRLSQAKSRNVELRTHLASDLPPVDADGKRITWVVGQLLDNAIKFTPSGGAVKVQTSSQEKVATVAVSDTGIGIPPEKVGEIFELFHQLDGSMTRRYGGTGLGLALVQSILQAHGTSISVQSQPGSGSRFAFSLPFSNPALMARATAVGSG